MSTHNRLLPGALLLASLASLISVMGAGCKSGGVATCSPACAAGTHCDDATGACVPDTAPVDLSAPAADLVPPTGCDPPCVAPNAYCNADRRCVPCLADANCPLGFVCKSTGSGSACVPGCADDSRCAGPDGGAGGAGGACCDGACVDTGADTANCGACGHVCTTVHGQGACVGGQCQPGQCDPGWGDCNNDPGDGCETNVHIDANNCTGCGKPCQFPNGLGACSDGCYLAACSFGFDDCNGDPSDGCEQDVTSDMKNCGGCGTPCTNKPHAKNTCIASSCVVTSCDPGYSDCNNDPSDGCEVATGTDANNCGKCGNLCPQGLVCVNSACTCPQCNIPNSKTKCVNNQCTFDTCLPGFADCNNNVADGCEVNLNTDKNNCGKCGNVCPMDTPWCGMGVCGMGCLMGQQPPSPCQMGTDPETGSPWVVCQADCNRAWIANANNNGGKYHLQQICQSLGYSKYGQYGGTCGDVCGYCGAHSCMNPELNTKFDGGGMGCGQDMFGPILCQTVHWECLK